MDFVIHWNETAMGLHGWRGRWEGGSGWGILWPYSNGSVVSDTEKSKAFNGKQGSVVKEFKPVKDSQTIYSKHSVNINWMNRWIMVNRQGTTAVTPFLPV